MANLKVIRNLTAGKGPITMHHGPSRSPLRDEKNLPSKVYHILMRYNQETLLYSAVTPLFYCLSCNHFNRCLIFELGRYTLPLTSAFFLDIKVVCIVFIFIYNTKIKVIIELFLSFELVTRINFKDTC